MSFDAIILVVAGLLVGSFISVIAMRYPAMRGVVLGRSVCSQCGRQLAARDMVPVISWIMQGGKCRYCRRPISVMYPTLEIGALAVPLWAATEVDGWLLWVSCALGWALLALSAIDFRRYVLIDALTGPIAAGGLGVAFVLSPDLLLHHAIGVGAGFLTFATVAAAYRRVRGREGLGLGDAKLLAAAGAWVSWWGLPTVVLIASSVGLAAILASHWMSGKPLSAAARLPFGPWLALGLWITWLYGPLELIH